MDEISRSRKRRIFAAIYLEVRGPKFQSQSIRGISPRIDKKVIDKNVGNFINLKEDIDKNVDSGTIYLGEEAPEYLIGNLGVRRQTLCITTSA